MEFAIASVLLGVWAVVLSVVSLVQFKFIRRLTKGSDDKDLVKLLKRILDRVDLNSKDIDLLKKELIRQDAIGRYHVQKIGIVRFNPFRETGGDHSFSLAILDGMQDGFVITGLHTRERTRIYLKEIKKGTSQIELSSEEKAALSKAQKS